MKLLFVHEGYITEENKVFYSNAYNSENILRYKTIANTITFLTRTKKFDKSDRNHNRLDIDGFNFIGVENYRSLKGVFNYNEIRKTIRDAVKRTDYLVARLPSDMGSLAIKYARRYDKKYLVELVGCPWDALWNHSILGKLLAPFLYIQTKKNIRKAPFVIYVTERYLQERYPTEGVSTNCSNVTLQGFNKSGIEDRIKRINNIDENHKLIIGTVGAVDVNYKGQEYIIKAIGELKKEGNQNFEYQLIGGGNQNRLKKIAGKYNLIDEIKFLGSLPHEEVFNWLDTIDIYIQPSLTEGLPRSVIEAMSKGLPVFGTNVGGIPELIDKDCLFKRKSIEDIKTKLILLDKTTLEHLSRENYSKAKVYEKSQIETKRNQIFKEFAKSFIKPE